MAIVLPRALPPLATEEYFLANFGPAPESIGDRLGPMLARASRIIRAACARVGIDVDQRIADGVLDADLVADIACEMVMEASNVPPDFMGASSVQQGAGPYQQTRQFSSPAGRLYLGKDARAKLGISTQRAFTVEMGGSS